MSKTIVFGDMHYGIRGDSKVFLDYQKKIADEVIFPYLKENKKDIDKLVFVGDIFDKRRQINIYTLNRVKEFFEQIAALKIPVIIIVGNHDTFFKNTTEINSPVMLFDKYENFRVVDLVPLEEGTDLYIPWMSENNVEKCMNTLENTEAQYVFGHFEINNAMLLENNRCDFGMDENLFKKFSLVFSGHFHMRQRISNIFYVGCLWELCRDDMVQDKGFFVLDRKPDGTISKVNFIPITDRYKIFRTITYDESVPLGKILPQDAKTFYENTYIKIIIKNNKNKVLWSRFMNRLESFSPAEVVFVDESENGLDSGFNDVMNKAASMELLDVVRYYLEDSFKDNPGKFEEIYTEFKNIYQESLENGD